MRESVTYQAILREGRQEGIIVGRAEGIMKGRLEGRIDAARRILLRQGTKRFGEPDVITVATIEAIEDMGPLETMVDRLVDGEIHGWDDLLRTP
jgi:predicted transposase YdaD